MKNQYFTIVTDLGTKKMFEAVTEGKKVNIAEFAVGDGGGASYTPMADATELVNEVWRGAVNACYVSEESENLLIIESVMPSDVGGFTIREMGIYDDLGTLIAVCNTPDTQKVKVSDGVVHELDLSMELALSNTEVVELIVDPTVVMATKKDVENLRLEVKAEIEEIKKTIPTVPIAIEDGGTGGTTAEKARENLGLGNVKNVTPENMTPTFTQATTRTNIKSGENLGTMFGKIAKFFADLKAAAFAGIANNCTTTEAGSVLDARQGKSLQDQVTQINSNLTNETLARENADNALIKKQIMTIDYYDPGVIKFRHNYVEKIGSWGYLVNCVVEIPLNLADGQSLFSFGGVEGFLSLLNPWTHKSYIVHVVNGTAVTWGNVDAGEPVTTAYVMTGFLM